MRSYQFYDYQRMKKLQAGVLGAGHLGKIHLRLLEQSESYDLVGFYDPDKNAAAALAEKKVILLLTRSKN